MKLTFEDGYKQALKDYKENPDLDKLLYDYAWGLKGFWFHNPKRPPSYDIWGNKNKKNDFKVIVTRYDKGYKQALDDLDNKLCCLKGGKITNA